MPPRLARLVALIAAVALIGGAFVLRGALSGGDDTVSTGPGSGGDGGDGGGDAPAAGYRVICDEDLGDAACAAIKALGGVDRSDEGFQILSAPDALTKLNANDTQFDAWVTLDPWPEIVDQVRTLDGLEPLSQDAPVPLASSAISLLTSGLDEPTCTGPVTWSCLAGAAAAGEGIGFPTLQSAAGTLFLGSAAVGLVGQSDFDITAATGGGIGEQLDELLDSTRPGTLADQAARATRPGEFDALATTQGRGTVTAGTNQGRQRELGAGPLDPPTIIGVVLAPIGANGAAALDRLVDQMSDGSVVDGLADAGWTEGPTLSEGLPAADLLYALREALAR